MSITFEEFAQLTDQQIVSWGDCPAISDQQFFIDGLVTAAWDRCYWDEDLPILPSGDFTSPGRRFALLNYWYRLTTYRWTMAHMFLPEQDTCPGLPPDANGRRYLVYCLEGAVHVKEPLEVADRDEICWEISVAAGLQLWDRLEQLLERATPLLSPATVAFVRLRLALLYQESWSGSAAAWASSCFDACRDSVEGEADLNCEWPSFEGVTQVPPQNPFPLGPAIEKYEAALLAADAPTASGRRILHAGALFREGAMTHETAMIRSAALLLFDVASDEYRSAHLDSLDALGLEGTVFYRSQVFAGACACAGKASDPTLWRQIAEEWVRLAPEDADAADAMAKCLAKAGDYDAAARWSIRRYRLAEDDGGVEDELISQLADQRMRDVLGMAFRLCRDGLLPYVELRLRQIYKDRWSHQLRSPSAQRDEPGEQDLTRLLAAFQKQTTFRTVSERVGLHNIETILKVRHLWAHQQQVERSSAEKALEAMVEMLRCIRSPEADRIEALRLGFRIDQAWGEGEPVTQRIPWAGGDMSPRISFGDVNWTIVPETPGAYVIYDGDEPIYVGMSGRDQKGTLRRRLRDHASGQIVNMFAQYLFLARAQFASTERIRHPRDAKKACRDYLVERCAFRFVTTADGAEGRRLERELKDQLKPTLNP